jgi:gas vesicle protein GvpA/GvpJ/GvpM family
VSDAERYAGGSGPLGNRAGGGIGQAPQPANLADILERVLDKGIVIAGDIQINLLDIELLTIKLRLLVASVDKAREMGIDWWERDPALSSVGDDDDSGLERENAELRARIDRLEERLGLGSGDGEDAAVEERSDSGRDE